MSWPFALGGATGLLAAVMLAGAPVFIAFLTLNLAGLSLLIGPRGFGLFANSLYQTATSSSLAAIALFVLMGEILFRSGAIEILFDSIDRLIGRVRGRLYVVTIALSTLFGALSGSAVAVAAMLGRSLLPSMAARGYDRRLAAATILSGASLAPIIPPSLLAIIVGSMADVSIAGLLIAGVAPGIVLAALTLGYVALRVARGAPAGRVEEGRPPAAGSAALAEAAADRPQAPRLTVARALLNLAPFSLTVFAVMGLILLGVATPSESAATGVVGACLTAAVFRRFSLAMLREALASTVTIAAAILLIICSAKLFSQLLSFSGATRGLVELAGASALGPDLTVLVMMLIPLILCMFIDQIAFMLLAIPIYEPIVESLGVDPILFWTLFLINLTVGSLTPPFGYTLFALKGAAGGALNSADVFRAAWPVVGLFLTGMALFWFAPGLVLWLPGLL
ncbi:MAG: TRAP transporter large permease [Marivibrio sp.]|uniref:TRAP transporter large permease n=1 Tax=Marivibrio sp. TaxID=2039719 RepID=UPI0032EBB223